MTGTRVEGLLAAVWLAVAASPTAAAVFAVANVPDAVDAAPGNGVCATAGGACSLRAAVQEANALAGNDAITLPAGVYPLAIPGNTENAAATGDLDVTQSLTITGAGPALTVVDGGAFDRIFQVIGADTTLELAQLTLRNGSSPTEGGAIRSAGVLLLSDCIVEGNQANAGGGVFSTSEGGFFAERCAFRDNDAVDLGFTNVDGGGLMLQASSTLESCSITGNTAVSGGAFVAANPSGPISLYDTTIADNVGGSSVYIQNGDAVLAHVTLTHENGDGISTFSFGSAHTFTIRNSAIAAGIGSDCFFPASNGPVVSRLGNNLSSDASCGFTAIGSIQNTDPLLGPLADNGGPTRTRLPLLGSPLIDAADPGQCTSFDQRGRTRPRDGDTNGSVVCDIGAVEVPEAGSLAAPLAAGLAVLARRAIARPRRVSAAAAGRG